MLIRFSVENFRSFSTKQEFNMISGRYTRHNDRVISGNNQDLLTISSIYGENGAGKSNFIKALWFLQKLVIRGSRDRNENIAPVRYKLDDNWLSKPSKFEIEFIIEKKQYLYTMSIINNRIDEEELYIINNEGSRDRIFTRSTDHNNKSRLKISKPGLKVSKEKEDLRRQIYQEELRPNQPFLYEGYNKDMKRLHNPYTWFNEILIIIRPESFFVPQIASLANDSKYQKEVTNLINKLKPGIDNLTIERINFDDFFGSEDQDEKEKILKNLTNERIYKVVKDEITYNIYLNKFNKPEVAKLVSEHRGVFGDNIKFEISEESDGTQRFINLMPALIESASTSQVYIIDELERSMHTSLVRQFIKTFISKRCKKNNTQLIYTTHNTNLMDLDLLRQDEIWIFTNKDYSSKIYSLSDYNVRFDKKIQKAYLRGAFGGIPEYSEEDE